MPIERVPPDPKFWEKIDQLPEPDYQVARRREDKILEAVRTTNSPRYRELKRRMYGEFIGLEPPPIGELP